MSLRGFFKTDVVTITPAQSISEAAQLMRDMHVGDVVVIDSQDGTRRPVGLLTDRDIALGCVAENAANLKDMKVDDIMSRDVVCAKEDEGVYEVVQKMRSAGVVRMPIIDDRGGLIGILTSKNILALINDELTEILSISDAQKEAGQGDRFSKKGRARGQVAQPTVQ